MLSFILDFFCFLFSRRNSYPFSSFQFLSNLSVSYLSFQMLSVLQLMKARWPRVANNCELFFLQSLLSSWSQDESLLYLNIWNGTKSKAGQIFVAFSRLIPLVNSSPHSVSLILLSKCHIALLFHTVSLWISFSNFPICIPENVKSFLVCGPTPSGSPRDFLNAPGPTFGDSNWVDQRKDQDL